MPAKRAGSRDYSPEVVDRSLLAVIAHGGNVTLAARTLKTQGVKVPTTTLRYWVNHSCRDRYMELEAAHAPEIEKRLAQQKRGLLTQIAGGLALGVEKTIDKLEAGSVSEPWKAARDLAVVSGIETRDYLLLTDRPTQITETRSVEDLQRRAAELLGIEGTAEEIPELASGEEVATPAGD